MVRSAASSFTVLLALVLVIDPVICFVVNPLDPSKTWHNPYDLIRFNFSNAPTGQTYEALLADVHKRVTFHSRNKAYGLPVLPSQTPTKKPYRWLMLELSGRGQDKTMVAVRQDNLYITAFTDKSGQWYVFQNKAKLKLIPGAIVLNFRDDYPGLVGGFVNLGSLPLGREPTLTAVHQLANYQHSPTSVAVKKAVAVMVVTISEASRFSHIPANIISSWVPGLTIGFQAHLVVRWKVISCALMVSTQNKNRWGDPANPQDEAKMLGKYPLHIQDLNEAIGTLRVLLRPKDDQCSEKITWLVQ